MPLDSTNWATTENLEEWQITLLKAAEIVRERWQQGSFGFHGGPRCVFGALSEVIGIDVNDEYNLSTPVVVYRHPAALALISALPMQDKKDGDGEDFIFRIPRWNDAEGRTAEEVARVMESVATQGRE